MLSFELRQKKDGEFCVYYKWHWYFASYHVHFATSEECIAFLTKILKDAEEHRQLEKTKGIIG